MEIKEMKVADLDFIAENLERDYDDFWNYNLLKRDLESNISHYVCAKQDGIVVGFGGIWTIVDTVHIANIVVKKDMRKMGIGSSILQELIKICKVLNMKEITLEVNEHNKAAINLYKKFGFEQVGLRKKYYSNTDNALIMTKSVKRDGSV